MNDSQTNNTMDSVPDSSVFDVRPGDVWEIIDDLGVIEWYLTTNTAFGSDGRVWNAPSWGAIVNWINLSDAKLMYRSGGMPVDSNNTVTTPEPKERRAVQLVATNQDLYVIDNNGQMWVRRKETPFSPSEQQAWEQLPALPQKTK